MTPLKNQRAERKALFRAFVFLSALLLPVLANAQDSRVILPAREISVRTALSEIEKQTDYNVAINWTYLNPDKKVFFAANSLTAKEIMAQVLAGTDLSWQLVGNQIAVTSLKESTEEYSLYSAMHRASLPQQMIAVPDPWATRQLSAEEIARVKNGYWQNKNGIDSIGLAVLNFRVNRTNLERKYMDNARALDIIHKTFSDKELLTAMDFITVTAAASPEGNTRANAKLAADRALAVKSYIMWKYPFMDRNRIFTFSIGEDWSGLYKMVMDDAETPYRDQVLEIIGGESDSDAKRSRLKSLGKGRAYRYIANNMLPRLRGAAACMIYYKEDPEPVVITQTDTVFVDRIVEKTIEVPVEVPVEIFVKTKPVKDGKPYYLALKTNLLYDAALLPNLAMEFSLPRRWSIELEGHWSWWNTDSGKHYFHRIQTGGLEVRKWLGRGDRTSLTGHYLGAYGMFGNYDIRLGDEGNLSESGSWSAGVSYGYAMPIGRGFNLEFGIGIGYFGGNYKKYTYDSQNDRYPWQSDNNRNYFGPTKAKVSLVWLVGSGKNQTKKR